MRIQKNIAYGHGHERQLLDVYFSDGETRAILVYFHGGGLEAGTKDDAIILSGLTEKGIALIAPGYRLYPNAHCPDFILDAAAAAAWAARFRDSHHPGKKLYLAGSSAGAYLAMMLCFDAKYLAVHGLTPDVFGGFIFDAGQPTVHFNVLREAGLDTQAVVVDERAPMYHVRRDCSYPPMLFLCAQMDIPGRYEQTLMMLSALKQSGYGDQVSFRHMEGFNHCEYNDKPVFQEILLQFMDAQ